MKKTKSNPFPINALFMCLMINKKKALIFKQNNVVYASKHSSSDQTGSHNE